MFVRNLTRFVCSGKCFNKAPAKKQSNFHNHLSDYHTRGRSEKQEGEREKKKQRSEHSCKIYYLIVPWNCISSSYCACDWVILPANSYSSETLSITRQWALESRLSAELCKLMGQAACVGGKCSRRKHPDKRKKHPKSDKWP